MKMLNKKEYRKMESGEDNLIQFVVIVNKFIGYGFYFKPEVLRVKDKIIVRNILDIIKGE